MDDDLGLGAVADFLEDTVGLFIFDQYFFVSH